MGELAQLSNRPSLVDAHAQSAVEALVIPSRRLRDVLVENADLGERIMRALILRRVGLLETGTGGPINETHTVSLHETAQGAVLTLNPTSLAFTNGQTKNFTVNNSGNVTAPYTLTVGGNNPGSFAVTPTSGTANAGNSVTESVTYSKPLLSGPQSATVSITSTAGRCAPLPAALTVSGN